MLANQDKSNPPTGLFWNKHSSRWVAYISKNGKQKYIGYFTDKNDAIKARKEAVITRRQQLNRINGH